MTPTVASVGRRATFMEIVRLMRDLPKEEFRDSDPDRYTQLRRLPDLAKAGARTMAHARVKRLPMVDELGLLEGVVSRSDLLSPRARRSASRSTTVRSGSSAGSGTPP